MYISMLSVHRFIQPRYVFLHGDVLPHGKWWKRIKADVANVFFINVTQNLPKYIFGKKIHRPEHVADVERLNIIYGKPR
jgi:hypothetical protein